MESPTILPECIALTVLRRLRGLSGMALSQVAGINEKSLSKYETATPPEGDRLAAFLELLDFDDQAYLEIVDVLHRVRARDRSRRDPEPATPVDLTREDWTEIRRLAAQAGRETEQDTLELLEGAARRRKADAARAEARALCDRLEKEPKPWLAVEKASALQTWAVAERLAHRSAEAAPRDPGQALELAALGCRAAELAPCSGPFRHRLLGYALTFRENALRASLQLCEAEAVAVQADEHWREGAAAPGPLAEWRRLSLGGSLLRDQRRYAESLALLDASLAAAPDSARASLLVTKALTVEQLGDPELAVELLTEAETAVARRPDPPLAFLVRLNLTSLLCRLERFAAAEMSLVRMEAVPGALRREPDASWLRWLRGLVDAGLGRRERAESAFRAALQGFTRRRAARDCALISLELALLLSRQRRARDLRELARGMDWILEEKKLSREAHAALRLFCDAAERGQATPDTVQRALHLLQRAPKADAPGVVPHPLDQGPGANDLATFTNAGATPDDASPLLAVDRRDDGATAAAAGIESATAVLGLSPCRGQEIAGRAPEAGHPGGQAVDEAGGLDRKGRAAREDR